MASSAAPGQTTRAPAGSSGQFCSHVERVLGSEVVLARLPAAKLSLDSIRGPLRFFELPREVADPGGIFSDDLFDHLPRRSVGDFDLYLMWLPTAGIGADDIQFTQ